MRSPGRRRLPGTPSRAGLALTGALALALAPALPAAADATSSAAGPAVSGAGSAAPSAPSAPPGVSGVTTRCTLRDRRLPEVSGLVDEGDRMVVMDDGGDRATVYVLDRSCAVVDVRTAPVDPYDPEDLARGSDGTLWLADTGDNRQERATVALIALRPDGLSAVHRFTYPDGPHDTEALLLAPDGTPYLVTKEVLGASSVYRPASAVDAGATVPLVRVGEVDVTLTGTPGGPAGHAGQLMVTGGAVSPDGTKVALRTYTDAYVWPLTGSDVAGALAGQRARIPLPEQQQGEAVSFTPDGTALVVAGEGLPTDVSVVPLAGAPASGAASAAAPSPAAATADASASPTPVLAALVAAALATVLVWIGGRTWRRHR